MAFSRKRQEEGAPDKTTAADILAERAADGSLSRRAVDALHDRFRARIQAKVDAAAPSGKADENLRATLFEYALAASKGRRACRRGRPRRARPDPPPGP